MVLNRQGSLILIGLFCWLLNLADAKAAPTGACYNSKDHTIINLGAVDQLERFSIETRHHRALEASLSTYKLADLENSKTAEAFLKGHLAFRQAIPAGYQAANILAIRNTGLKFVILKPDNSSEPWIFAFAGTENLIDWFSDFNLGRNQLAQVMALADLFTDCDFADETGLPLSARSWIITGHSLGGGLAQAFAFFVQQERMRKGLPLSEIELVTFNAFGTSELLDRKPIEILRIMKDMPAANYFLTGDPISRLGKHIGLTLEVRMPPPKITELRRRHSLLTVRDQIDQHGGFAQAVPASPPRAPHWETLKKYGTYAKNWPRLMADGTNRRYDDLEVLEKAAAIIAQRQWSAPFDPEARLYIFSLAKLFTTELETQPQGIIRDLLLERLKRVIARCTVFRIQ